MSQEYYVYVYFDPRQNPLEPIYVGKGKGNRWKNHLSWTHNPFLRRKIQRIRNAGMEPVIEISVADLGAKEAAKEEVRLIVKYGRVDLGTGSLCNFTDGGEGSSGWVPSAETRQTWSQQRSGPQTPAQYKANCARTHTQEAKNKISKANIGHPVSEKQREATRQYNRTREITDAMRQKWSATRKAMGISPEHQRKMKDGKRRAQAARTEDERTAIIEKSAKALRGKKRSEETKRRMREAWQKRRDKWGPSGQPPKTPE